ncbi:MAG: hypothetical protein ACQKBV_13805 [Puniceicoccales bacterium]
MGITIARTQGDNRREAVKVVANPIARGIQFDLSDKPRPVEVNLNTLFGCTGLEYRVTAETPGVVEVALDEAQGLLRIWPALPTASPGISWIIVQGATQDGVSAIIAFEVRVA